MRVITANVNGIRAAQRRGGLEWLAQQEPDVVAMQEVRASAKQFATALVGSALAEYELAHAESAAAGREGVAILTKHALASSSCVIDGFDEIAELRLNANLVMLSACDTGSGIRSQALARRSGQEEAGSTLQGLVRAFLAANARAVMATHWEVPAVDGTYAFTQSFYGAARFNSIGGALRTAQRGLIADPATSHPFYWGAYFVVGDSSKKMLGR